MINCNLYLITGYKEEKGKMVPDKKFLGMKEFYIRPALYSDYLMRRKKYQKDKPEVKIFKASKDVIQKFCDEQAITIEQYYEIEKAQEKKNKEMMELSTGILKYKGHKYRIESIDNMDNSDININLVGD